jgi:hypothetical protein
MRKLLALLAIFIMLYSYAPISPITSEKKTDDKSIIVPTNIEPTSATRLQFISFSINGTELFEEGIYYCFRNDTLDIKLTTDLAVNTSTIMLHHPNDPMANFVDFNLNYSGQSGSEKNWEYSLFLPNDKKTGLYNATLIIANQTTSENFHFNLSLMNPAPRILKAEINDYKYQNSVIRLVEGEEYRTYHFAEINVTCYVADIDGLNKISSVRLDFEKGIKNQWDTRTFAYYGETVKIGSYTTRVYQMTQNITISLDSSSEMAKANWTIGVNYNFKINATDIDGASFDFPWNVVIENFAPKITQFNVESAIDPTTYANNNRINLKISANGTDPEANAIFGTGLYNFTQEILPSSAFFANRTEISRNVSAIYSLDNQEHLLNINSQNHTYYVNFSLGTLYNFRDDDLIKDWKIHLGLNIRNIAPGISNVSIFNYFNNDWEKISDGSNLFIQTDVNTTIILLNGSKDASIGNYFEWINQTNLFRLKFDMFNLVPFDLGIDMVKMTFKVQRPVVFSDLILKVYEPTKAEFIQFNMINHFAGDWDASGTLNRWCMNLSIATNASFEYAGAWTFILEAYDYGTSSYSEINATEFNGVNVISSKSFTLNDKRRSFDTSTIILQVGVDENKIISVSNVNINATVLSSNQDVNISATLKDYNASSPFSYINQSFIPISYQTALMNGSFNFQNTPYSSSYLIRSDEILPINNSVTNKTQDTMMIEKDDYAYRFKIDEIDYDVTDSFAYIVPIKVDMKYWLQRDNISRIWIDVDQWVDTTNPPTIRYGEVEVWDFIRQMWILPMNESGLAEEENTWYQSSSAPGIRLAKYSSDPQGTWRSPEWSNQTSIVNCIEANSLRMYVRVKWVFAEGGDYQMNASVDYLRLLVEFKNYHDMKLGLFDDKTNIYTYYNMYQAYGAGTTRVWYTTIPVSLISARSYHFVLWAQNGNSSIRYERGQIQGVASAAFDQLYVWRPKIDLSLGINSSYNFRKLSSPIYLDVAQYASITNLHRNKDPLLFNGTLYSNFNYSTYQECGLTGKTLSSVSGLKPFTDYKYKLSIDGGFLFEYTIRTGADTTFAGIIPLMNEGLTGAKFDLVDGDLRCTSNNLYSNAKIILERSTELRYDLFANITGFTSFDFPIVNTFNDLYLELRNLNMNSTAEWDRGIIAQKYFPDVSNIFTYDFVTKTWNINVVFLSNTLSKSWRSGVWFYRVYAMNSERSINVTEWSEFRLQNFQPKDIQLTGLESGNYYRVISDVNYGLSFVDMEGNNNTNQAKGDEFNLEISFLVQNRDKNLIWERWNSNTIPNFISVIGEENRFNFEGKINFGREIQIGNYSDVYIRVKDLDPDWPQVGTLRVTDRIFHVMNNIPFASIPLTTNATAENLNDKVYRNNWIRIYTKIIDYDDFAWQVTPRYFSMSYYENEALDLGIRNLNNSLVNQSDGTWIFDLFVYRTNQTGYWNITTNFQDPDNASLIGGTQYLSIEILNNLPRLLNMWYRNLDTGITAYVGNQTGFGIYRGNETLQITADLVDVEDTWLVKQTTNYSIKSVTFSLYNNFQDPIQGIYLDEYYDHPSFKLDLVKNGSQGVFESSVSSYINNPVTWTTTGLHYESQSMNIKNLTVYGNMTESTSVNDLVEAGDNKFQNITYWRDIQGFGGEYRADLSLPQLFDLHATDLNFNLSMYYRLVNLSLTVDIFNFNTGNWEKLSSNNELDGASATNFIWQNLTIPANRIRDFANESFGNKISLRFYSVNFISNVSQKGEFHLDKLSLIYYKTSDEHYERWVGQIVIPAEAEYHAGDLKLNMLMTDNDNGTGANNGNLIRVFNVPPRFVDDQIWIEVNEGANTQFTRMQFNSEYRVSYRTGNIPVINIYIQAIDPDLPNVDIIWIMISATTIVGDFEEFWSYGSIGFSAPGRKVPNTTNVFKIEIAKNQYDLENIDALMIFSISIADNERNYCDGLKYPYTATISNINLKIKFNELTRVEPKIDWIPFAIVGGILGAVGLVFFWRRYLSYRKYLNSTE